LEAESEKAAMTNETQSDVDSCACVQHQQQEENEEQPRPQQEAIDVVLFPLWKALRPTSTETEPIQYSCVTGLQRTMNALLFAGTDLFVAKTRGNTSLKKFCFCISNQLHRGNLNGLREDEYYRRWRRIGKGLANLTELKELEIRCCSGGSPDYTALACVLGSVHQIEKLTINFPLLCPPRDGEPIRCAFQCHPNLKEMIFKQVAKLEALEAFAPYLSSIPNLQIIDFTSLPFRRVHPGRVLPDSFFPVLKHPRLRRLSLSSCRLSETQCHDMARLLPVCSLQVLDLTGCQLEGAGAAVLTKALQTTLSLEELQIAVSSLSPQAYQNLGEALLVNKTLKRLALLPNLDNRVPVDCLDVLPVLRALAYNSTLQRLMLVHVDHWNELLADTLGMVLKSPTTGLQELTLLGGTHHHQVDLRSFAWRRMIPALRENKSLNLFSLSTEMDAQHIVEIASMVKDNSTLEGLELFPCLEEHLPCVDEETSPRDYITAQAVHALQGNHTLKHLDIHLCHCHCDRESSAKGQEALLCALQGNYGLEFDENKCLAIFGAQPCHVTQQILSISKLNQAGRRYLLNEPSNRAVAVAVLSRVSDNLNSIFFHLVENPSLLSNA
jgi:hypothetical protein